MKTEDFETLVAPHREALCIEPYTCVPGAAAMHDPAAAGLRILGPGELFEARVEFEIS